MPRRMAKRLNWRSTTRPTSAWAARKIFALRTLTWPLGIGRARVRATLRVDVAVDDVVIGAAGAAHGDGADQEEDEMPRVGVALAEGIRRERRRPPAREEEQPPADRPVEPRHPRIGLPRLRQEAVDPVAARGVGDGGGGIGQSGASSG